MSKKINLFSVMFSMLGFGSALPVEEVTAKESKKAADPAYSAPAPKAGTTYLAANSTMEGKLQTDGDVEIAGTFNGDIIAKGKVILHSNMQGNITAASLQLLGCCLNGNVVAEGQVIMDREASVTGNVTAGELICSGNIKGDLMIKGNLALNESSKVEGNITTGTMTMSRGASIAGGVKMNYSGK